MLRTLPARRDSPPECVFRLFCPGRSCTFYRGDCVICPSCERQQPQGRRQQTPPAHPGESAAWANLLYRRTAPQAFQHPFHARAISRHSPALLPSCRDRVFRGRMGVVLHNSILPEGNPSGLPHARRCASRMKRPWGTLANAVISEQKKPGKSPRLPASFCRFLPAINENLRGPSPGVNIPHSRPSAGTGKTLCALFPGRPSSSTRHPPFSTAKKKI